MISKVDREEAIATGELAVKTALEGRTGKMVITKRISSNPYKAELKLCDLREVANAEAVITPDLMYDKTRFSDKFREYLRPLIEGEVEIKYVNGIAQMAKWKKVKVEQ